MRSMGNIYGDLSEDFSSSFSLKPSDLPALSLLHSSVGTGKPWAAPVQGEHVLESGLCLAKVASCEVLREELWNSTLTFPILPMQ